MGERLKYWLYLALFMPLAWLPLPALYLLSDLLRPIFQHVIHYRRKVIRRNLQSCYPEKSEAELREIENEFYRQFTDNIVETVKLLHISDRTMRSRLEVVGAHLVEEAADAERPVILYLGHYCNWEWVPAITLYFNRPRSTSQIYKPLHDRAFDRLMLRVRSRFGAESIDMAHAVRRLLRLRQTDGTFITGFIADSRTSWRATNQSTMFLRHKTMFYPGGEEIGSRMNARFLYLDVSKLGRGRYRFEFKEIQPQPDAPDYPYTRSYLSMLQDTIDRQPAYWLWSHKRWV